MPCENCNSCDYCDSCQRYCQTNQCSQSGFSFSQCIEQNQIIGPGYFDYTTWNEGIAQIKNVFTTGQQGPNISSMTAYTVTTEISKFLSATEFNRVCDMLLTDNNKDSYKVNQNDIVQSTYFKNLQTAIANLKYTNAQCSNCDNGECDTPTNCSDE